MVIKFVKEGSGRHTHRIKSPARKQVNRKTSVLIVGKYIHTFLLLFDNRRDATILHAPKPRPSYCSVGFIR